MTNRVLVSAIAAVCFAVVCFALMVDAQPHKNDFGNRKAISITYYSDSSFTTVVGQSEDSCDQQSSVWGVASDYRYICTMDCRYQTINCRCQQYMNGAWAQVQCPSGL